MTEHQDIKEFFEKNAVSYNDNKYSQFSVTTPFAWHPDRILLQKNDDPAVQELQNVVKILAKQALGCRTTFFSDAISFAMIDYRHSHNEPCGTAAIIAFDVLTTAGDHLVYTVKFPASAFHSSSDLSEFTTEIVNPTSLKLINMAIKDVKFEDVLAVKAYVGEISTLIVGGTNVPSEERN
jgi:hypothetical protein